MTLATLTLDQIPGLTDEEYAALYFEAARGKPFHVVTALRMWMAGRRDPALFCSALELSASGEVCFNVVSSVLPVQPGVVPTLIDTMEPVGAHYLRRLRIARDLSSDLLLDHAPDIHAALERVWIEPNPCRADCPASVLEGLPALVERWTGRRVILELCVDDGCLMVYYRWACGAIVEANRTLSVFDDNAIYRHLPHACLCAAFAACVVLGRKG